MTNQVIYSIVLAVVITSAGVVFVLAPTQAAVAIPLFTLVAVGVINLLQTSVTAAKTVEIAEKQDALVAKSEEQDTKIGEVKVIANNTQRMGEAVHTLVNSNMGSQLRISAAALRRVADMTKDTIDIQVADEAKALYDEHQSKQAVVDSKPPATATTSGLGTGTPAGEAAEEKHVEAGMEPVQLFVEKDKV